MDWTGLDWIEWDVALIVLCVCGTGVVWYGMVCIDIFSRA